MNTQRNTQRRIKYALKIKKNYNTQNTKKKLKIILTT